MPEHAEQSLNHFSAVRFRDAFWREPHQRREEIRNAWLRTVGEAAESVHLYQSFGPQARTDVLLWCACHACHAGRPGDFFTAFARAAAPVRHYLEITSVLWGFTRPSQYAKKRSDQEIDPFSASRAPYLIMYPFVKSPKWYLTPPPERQAVMVEHMKVGKKYKDIAQLLLYSFGLQDQEFVVVYEMSDLLRFLELVNELRSTRARLYTKRDTPLYSGIYQTGAESLSSWL